MGRLHHDPDCDLETPSYKLQAPPLPEKGSTLPTLFALHDEGPHNKFRVFLTLLDP